MKKAVRFLIFAWWFLLVGDGGSFAPKIFMVVGPFNTEDDCIDRSDWAKKNGAEKISVCWEGAREPRE
ncbi:MAG: hypothetical protein KGZ30_01075 [Anaplasmataceae bacterium]|nr:hypothetical protein [Anaplasmataceae bacterium]